MNGLRIAVVGATGAVGGVLLRVIEERGLQVDEIRLCASERSWGRQLAFQGRNVAVEPVTPELLSQVDIVFIAAGSGISREVAPMAVEQGAFVIDKSSAFRMDPDVPLVVPELNPADLAGHNGMVSTPNCSTTQLVMALKPLDDANPVTRTIVDTYQSVSGTGAAAMEELRLQSGAVLDGGSAQPSEYPHQIAFNVLPQVETFLDNGYTTEEMKMVEETRKIMHRPDLPVSATCARVPVMVSHSEAVHVEFEHPMTRRRCPRDTLGCTRRRGRRRSGGSRVPYAHRWGGSRSRLRRADTRGRLAPKRYSHVARIGQPAKGRRAQRRPDSRGGPGPRTS